MSSAFFLSFFLCLGFLKQDPTINLLVIINKQIVNILLIAFLRKPRRLVPNACPLLNRRKRELPSELQGIFDKEEVDVKVEDKKSELCVSTKPVFQPFSGQGHRLGSATPKIVSKAKSIEVENKNNLSTVSLNNLEPITNIQIWLANGKRIVQKFNTSHRVSHIKDFIEKYQGSQRSSPFSLATALPVLKLLDETLTVEEADLQNAVIIQRLKKTAEPLREFS
uniref:UBX domain-containing protein 2A n=1 Tax=Ictidomys tridecemlineatus TaxID=43179 RepID=UPI001A9F0DBB|nr:UBX domain-containing protein 2A [Ictidomys tridecemlineatus]